MDGQSLQILGFMPATLVGAVFWALGFYLICGGLIDRALDGLTAEWLQPVASVGSIFPFLLGGLALEVGMEAIANPSWGISCAILTCSGFGIFRLGQLDNEAYQESLKERGQDSEQK